MNVNEISDGLVTPEMNRMSKAGEKRGDVSSSSMKPVEDTVQMSDLAKIVSKTASELGKVHELRPEVVAKFKRNIDDVSDISDDAIDKIYDRMFE